MDCRQENGFSNGDVVQILSGNSGNDVDENWNPQFSDQAIWATEDDYGMWNGDASADINSNYGGRPSKSRSGSEPLSKRSRTSQSGDLTPSNRAKAIGKMFYKTKLCCKFQAATCPYINNCNFAHSVEELRRPPSNWQELVAAHEEEQGTSSEPREEFQIPILGVTDDTQRSYKGRHCKKFYTEEGFPYGEDCSFLHDEQSKGRESVAISLGPGNSGGYGNNVNGSTLKPSNWKTRICNKWEELTGYCPFGSKCHFAHGATELHHFGGSDSEVKDSTLDANQGTAVPAKTTTDTVVASLVSIPHSNGYHMGVPSQRLSNVSQKALQRPIQKWKGPDKISKIYGNWIDDL